MHAMHLRTKGLSENLLDTTIAEELSKDVLRVDVVKLWASARTHILSKHIIVFTFARIAQARIRGIDFLESLLCTRGSIFVWMYFESKLLEKGHIISISQSRKFYYQENGLPYDMLS